MRQGLKRRLVFDAEIALGLGVFFENSFEFAERFAGFDHDAQDLERTDDTVACGGVVAEDHVSALLAADIVSIAEHGFDDIAVADLGAEDFSTVGFERFIEPEVAHDGRNQGAAFEAAALKVIDCCDGHDLVAIDQLTVFVAEKDAVGIAVVGDTDMRLALARELLDLLGGAATVNWGSGFILFHFMILQCKQLRVSPHRLTRMLVVQRITMPSTISRGNSDLRCCILVAVW